jgi:hypothetical protein
VAPRVETPNPIWQELHRALEPRRSLPDLPEPHTDRDGAIAFGLTIAAGVALSALVALFG